MSEKKGHTNDTEADVALQQLYKKREEAYHYSHELQDEVEIEQARREKLLTAKAVVNLLLVGVLIVIILGLYIHAYS